MAQYALTAHPKMQFFDDSGEPLSGGKVYVYLLGTSTPAVTYEDYLGATPNANPIILDAAGRADIWVDVDPLTFTIYNSADVLQSGGGDVVPTEDFGELEDDVTGLVSTVALMQITKANVASPTFTGTPKAPTAAVGTDTTQLATTAYVLAAIASIAAAGTPIGGSIMWDSVTDPATMPTEGTWMIRNGDAISRTTYADYYAIVGDMFGAGDGSTTFNLPDNRGEHVRMQDLSSNIDPNAAVRTDRGDGTLGDSCGTKQAAALLNHSHSARGNSGATHGITTGSDQSVPTADYGSTGGVSGGSTDNLVVNFCTLFIVRVL